MFVRMKGRAQRLVGTVNGIATARIGKVEDRVQITATAVLAVYCLGHDLVREGGDEEVCDVSTRKQ